MTLAAEDDVRRRDFLNAFERNVTEWFDDDLQTWPDPLQGRLELARAGSLAIDGVVDKINEQSYFKQ